MAQERLLWLQLSETEREAEQQVLNALWGHRGAVRTLPVNPQWGPWATALGIEVAVSDNAFGLPTNAFRPLMKGIQVLVGEHPELQALFEWLWKRGFHPVGVTGEELTLIIPPHRIVQESERLVGVLLRDWPSVPVTHTAEIASVTVKGSYDPVTGQASLLLGGVLPGLFAK